MVDQPFQRPLRGWLVLARASNLPTVWSNCLAGWWLGGNWPIGAGWGRLAMVLGGASALYTAGMFLNDVFDLDFDRQYRPIRPLVTGQVSPRAALAAAVGLLAVGTGLLGGLGWRTFSLTLVLDVLIVLYNWLHKRTSVGLVLMAGCRLLLYPLASSAAFLSAGTAAWGQGGLLATYVFGLSCLARGEHRADRRPPRWPWLFIVAPVVCNAVFAARLGVDHLIAVALPAFWLARVFFAQTGPLGGSRVASLLAGIILFDLSALAACTVTVPWLGWFAILFVLALLFQRFVPAT